MDRFIKNWMFKSEQQAAKTEYKPETQAVKTSGLVGEPLRVMDAPNYTSDFYPNVMKWCQVTGLLVIALQGDCYVWNYRKKETFHIASLGSSSSSSLGFSSAPYLSCISISPTGTKIALFTSVGSMLVFRVSFSDFELVAKMDLSDDCKGEAFRLDTEFDAEPDADRICSAVWSHPNRLIVGNRRGTIFIVNVEGDGGSPVLAKIALQAHDQEISAIYKQSLAIPSAPTAWMSGALIATGGNDNCAQCWDERMAFSRPILYLEHGAAVKALKWGNGILPSHLLVSGAGSRDQKLYIWNTLNGEIVSTHQTQDQICDLEIVAETHPTLMVVAHGYNSPHLATFHISNSDNVKGCGNSCRNLQIQSSVPDGGGSDSDRNLRYNSASAKNVNRILQLAQYNGMIASVATDEYLKIWRVEKGSSSIMKIASSIQWKTTGLVNSTRKMRGILSIR